MKQSQRTQPARHNTKPPKNRHRRNKASNRAKLLDTPRTQYSRSSMKFRFTRKHGACGGIANCDIARFSKPPSCSHWCDSGYSNRGHQKRFESRTRCQEQTTDTQSILYPCPFYLCGSSRWLASKSGSLRSSGQTMCSSSLPMLTCRTVRRAHGYDCSLGTP